MKNKKKVLIISLIGITLIISGFIFMFISSVKQDQKEMNSRMKKIISSYDDFSSDIEKFNETRDLIHNEFLDKVYYETLEQNDTSYKNKLYEYEKLVSTISKNSKTLRNYCKGDVYYSSSDANSKCASFKLGYEEMVNTFVEDINIYNTNIKNYNNYLDSEGKTDSLKLEEYKTNKTYIDYNKDGEYSGKEENDNDGQ